MQNIPQPHRQSTKLRNMIVNIEIELLIKFGTSGCRVKNLELKSKKCVYTYYM